MNASPIHPSFCSDIVAYPWYTLNPIESWPSSYVDDFVLPNALNLAALNSAHNKPPDMPVCGDVADNMLIPPVSLTPSLQNESNGSHMVVKGQTRFVTNTAHPPHTRGSIRLLAGGFAPPFLCPDPSSSPMHRKDNRHCDAVFREVHSHDSQLWAPWASSSPQYQQRGFNILVEESCTLLYWHFSYQAFLLSSLSSRPCLCGIPMQDNIFRTPR